ARRDVIEDHGRVAGGKIHVDERDPWRTCPHVGGNGNHTAENRVGQGHVVRAFPIRPRGLPARNRTDGKGMTTCKSAPQKHWGFSRSFLYSRRSARSSPDRRANLWLHFVDAAAIACAVPVAGLTTKSSSSLKTKYPARPRIAKI